MTERFEDYCILRAAEEFATKERYYTGNWYDVEHPFSESVEDMEEEIDNAMASKWNRYKRFKQFCLVEHFLDEWLYYINIADGLGMWHQDIEDEIDRLALE